MAEIQISELQQQEINIKPQAGKQERFLSTDADIAIYGGAAGSGKTYSILVEALRNISNPNFSAVIFRRTSNQITTAGGLLDESKTLFPLFGAYLKTSPDIQWSFPSGSKVQFRHLQYEKDLDAWQGSQIPLICFEELTHFTKRQFMYMLSRLRSTCGVRPYMRATCNPDPDSFVASLVEWWIDQDTGYPIEERCGIKRWFVVSDDVFEWGDSKDEVEKRFPNLKAKSFTFINASIFDNKILIEKDPDYLANLDALGTVDRERLRNGNWHARPVAGLHFKREWFKFINREDLPTSRKKVRAWDLAATEKTANNDPDATAGIKMSEDQDGNFYIENMVHMFASPARVNDSIKNVATQDGIETRIRLPQDPGQAGKSQAEQFSKMLCGYKIVIKPVTGSKIIRSSGFSSQCEHGNVYIVKDRTWNDRLINELEGFPDAAHDDIVDACADAFNELSSVRKRKRTFQCGKI